MTTTIKNLRNVSSSFLILLFAIIFYSCSSIATVTVPPNEQFLLGEYSDKSFSAKVTNLSRREVKVSIIDTKNREQTQGFGLPGGNHAKINVSSSEAVTFINQSNKDVKVRAKLDKNVEGMRYEKVDK